MYMYPTTLVFPVVGQPVQKMLLGMKKVRFGRGKYNGFGGKADAGESMRAAAVRELRLPVTNTGARAGVEVVQLYLRDPVAAISRPVRELRGFQRLSLAPGETAEAVFHLTVEDLRYDRGPALGQTVRDWEGGDFIVMVGASAGVTQSASLRWEK